MSVFFISDTHFDHAKIIGYTNRPFKDKDEMNAAMIFNWANTVGCEDEVYHLGDVALGGGRNSVEYAVKVLNDLPGKKYLVPGNHDVHLDILEKAFVILPLIFEISVQLWTNQKKQVFELCHYPMLSWPKEYKGSIHLHGHVHGKKVGDRHVIRRIDIGVDVWGFTPVKTETIMSNVKHGEKQHPELCYENFTK